MSSVVQDLDAFVALSGVLVVVVVVVVVDVVRSGPVVDGLVDALVAHGAHHVLNEAHDDLRGDDGRVVGSLVLRILIGPAVEVEVPPGGDGLEVHVGRGPVVGDELDDAGVFGEEEGVGEAGSVHAYQDVSVDNEVQLLSHIEEINLYPPDGVIGELFAQLRDEFLFVLHLALDEAARVARVSHVVPAPDEEH